MRLLFKKIYPYLTEKAEVNYLYFSVFLTGLILFSFSYFLLLEQPIVGIHLFFLLYAFGQAFLETWVFIFITYVLKKWAPRWALFLFICISFLLLLLHFTNFTMLRLMDISISYPFKFLFGAGIDHLIVGFQALNMHLGMIAIIFFSLLLIPIGGLLLYWSTNHVVKKRPWNISLKQIALALAATTSLLLCLDCLAQPYINQMIYKKYKKALPFGTTFLGPTPHIVTVDHSVLPLFPENDIAKKLPSLKTSTTPNIYLFVIETLRKDFVNQKTAPILTTFGKENIEISRSFANANGTHLSWFSIFHANIPLHWTTVRDQWNKGSPPLQLLKNLGYKIIAYSAADLRYFGMDQVLFGEKRSLVDEIKEFSFLRNIEPCDRDALCMDAFEENISKEEGKKGNVYLFFLDSTHSEYSFPKDFPLKFTPIAKQIDYLTLTKKEIEPIKNRYRNSIAYVDSLMDRFFTILKKETLYEEAIIAITGDHGEEFFEEGALFHGTHLNSYQTEVPIFFKCPGWAPWTTEATHIDIFPSLLHHITGHSDFSSIFNGISIFTENMNPYRITVMQNGPDIPCEFSVHKRMNKLHARLLPTKNGNEKTQIEIIELNMPEETSDTDPTNLIEKYFANL